MKTKEVRQAATEASDLLPHTLEVSFTATTWLDVEDSATVWRRSSMVVCALQETRICHVKTSLSPP
jgi:hypothetical protein